MVMLVAHKGGFNGRRDGTLEIYHLKGSSTRSDVDVTTLRVESYHKTYVSMFKACDQDTVRVYDTEYPGPVGITTPPVYAEDVCPGTAYGTFLDDRGGFYELYRPSDNTMINAPRCARRKATEPGRGFCIMLKCGGTNTHLCTPLPQDVILKGDWSLSKVNVSGEDKRTTLHAVCATESDVGFVGMAYAKIILFREDSAFVNSLITASVAYQRMRSGIHRLTRFITAREPFAPIKRCEQY
ncbi:hypothetical protein [Crucian carp herpesvirus]|uniref:ORF122 n=1 Tax=Cyprinid herpesvirus 2 TaxID=317878 RepID=K7PBG6_CYHV2|nr:protein ORF122 [Cyprinid herpesvirus 2]APD51585.1 hypothetical protein [Crucian carp herpesvirus]AFJ20544.1 protein ORF122 [Cyprinid herpesvirus 2]AKC02062.1 hypothetical protein [Cyprinid herpesvirus 2]AMB21688.1 ORF122 [Cyprinid herpesvirus 2]QAU54841.1 protein ORF122 [Cyprinid herpesvirus 2]